MANCPSNCQDCPQQVWVEVSGFVGPQNPNGTWSFQVTNCVHANSQVPEADGRYVGLWCQNGIWQLFIAIRTGEHNRVIAWGQMENVNGCYLGIFAMKGSGAFAKQVGSGVVS